MQNSTLTRILNAQNALNAPISKIPKGQTAQSRRHKRLKMPTGTKFQYPQHFKISEMQKCNNDSHKDNNNDENDDGNTTFLCLEGGGVVTLLLLFTHCGMFSGLPYAGYLGNIA